MDRAYDTCPGCGDPKRKCAAKCRKCSYATSDIKRCLGPCGRDLPLSAFRVRTRATPKPRSRCKECEADAQKARDALKPAEAKNAKKRGWEKANPDLHKRQRQRRSITVIGLKDQALYILDLLAVYASCPICGRPKDEARPHIDHDHETGRFRGIICQHCNLGLGHFRDSPQALEAAAAYLKCASHIPAPNRE